MWNMNDVYVANERIEDMRRAADKHNAIARMKAEKLGKQHGKKANNEMKRSPLQQARKMMSRVMSLLF